MSDFGKRESPQSMEKGSKKYRESIHKDSKRLDDYGNLPYTFSVPTKQKPLRTHFRCNKCGHESAVTEDTITVICGFCKNLVKIKNIRKKGLFNG